MVPDRVAQYLLSLERSELTETLVTASFSTHLRRLRRQSISFNLLPGGAKLADTKIFAYPHSPSVSMHSSLYKQAFELARPCSMD